MKRKIFSTLLMGAFIFASLSTVTSCKDYDDDINSLQTEQAALSSKVTALQSDVASAQSTATAAQSTANDALTQAKDALAKANAAATQTDLDALKDRVKAAEADLDAAEEKLKTLDTLSSDLAQLKKDVANCATKEELDELAKKFDTYQSTFDSLFAMVTGVELFGTYSGSAFNLTNITGASSSAAALKMMHGNVAFTDVFGDNEALESDLATVYATAEPTKSFTKGDDIKTATGLLLRVQPSNADLTKSNILIVNSKGEALDDYVEVLTADAKPYNSLITRGTTISNGLWSVPVQFKDGVDIKTFQSKLKNNKDKDILFAVAVNNTDTIARYAISTYDLTLNATNYSRAEKLLFTVDDYDIEEIHNRWAKQNGSASYYPTTYNEGNSTYAEDLGGVLKEYAWNSSTEKDYEAPNSAIKVNKDGSKTNVKADTEDARNDMQMLKAKLGVPMTVSLYDDQNGSNNTDGIAYYYVTLDENFAIESAPSELNAWKSYTYKGLGVMTKATDDLQITVDKLSGTAKGDVIGFRLYAVNYDGTLVDPDGRAFYALVGDEETKNSVEVTITADTTQPYAIVALDGTFVSCTDGTSGSFTTGTDALDEKLATTTEGGKIYYQLGKYAKDGKTFVAVSDWKDATLVKVQLLSASNFQDGKSWTVVANGTKGNTLDNVVNTLSIKVNKVMPTESKDKITWKTNQAKDGVYTCYVEPSQLTGTTKAITATWSTLSDNGYKNLWNAVNGIKDEYYTFEIASAEYDAETEGYTATKKVTGSANDQYNLTVNKSLIDSKTEHAITVAYQYQNVSLTRDKDDATLWSKEHNYAVNALDGKIIFACAVADPVQTYAWKVVPATYNEDGTVKKAAYSNNYVIYEQTDKFGDDNVTAANLYKEIVGTNTWDPDFGGTVWATKPLYNSIKSCKLVTADGENKGLEEYYNVSLTTNGAMTWALKSGATNPQYGDVNCNLVIVATDAYGHDNTITLPFVVKQKK